MRPGVTVAIPTIPPRVDMLNRAVRSVMSQSRPAEAVSVAIDSHHEGAGATRTRALRNVSTEWTAFLDDDDYFYPHHLDTLMTVQEHTGALVCWSWWDGNKVWDYECEQGRCPDNCHRHKAMDFEHPHLFGITYLVKTELAQQCTFPGPDPGEEFYGNEDYLFLLQLIKLTEPKDWAHDPQVTWHYSVHGGYGGNTSGRGDRW
jgi:hypothetical protein